MKNKILRFLTLTLLGIIGYSGTSNAVQTAYMKSIKLSGTTYEPNSGAVSNGFCNLTADASPSRPNTQPSVFFGGERSNTVYCKGYANVGGTGSAGISNSNGSVTGFLIYSAPNLQPLTVQSIDIYATVAGNITVTYRTGWSGGVIETIPLSAINTWTTINLSPPSQSFDQILITLPSAPTDSTAPRVASITRQNPTTSPTSSDTVTWRVTFSENVSNVDATDFTVSGTTATRSVNAISQSVYDVTISGGDLPNLEGTVTLGFAGSQNIKDAANNSLTNTTPTGANDNSFLMRQGPSEAQVVETTKRVIQNFNGARARLIASQGPAISGFLTGDVSGADTKAFLLNTLASLTNSGDRLGNAGGFALSSRQVDALVNGLNSGEAGASNGRNATSLTNVWIKGRWTRSSDGRAGVGDSSKFGIVYIGADYRYSPDLLIGVMGQHDWFDQSSSAFGSKSEGNGWMIGPYMVSRVSEQMILDARVAWGLSNNKVNPFGTYWDKFNGERWQFEGNLTGNFRSNQWNIAPTLGLNYFKETQKGYADSNGFQIAAQDTEAGTLSLGPKVTYLYEQSNSYKAYPFAVFKAIWAFKSPSIYSVNGDTTGTDGLRGSVGVGINLITSDRLSMNAAYTYDGIGVSNYESRTTEISATLPIDRNGLPKGSRFNVSYSLQNTMYLRSNDSKITRLGVSIPF